MTYIITALCLRDSSCVDVCPVECIIPGKPEAEWPWFYIDPDTCIDCGACVPECPYEAIFEEDEESEFRGSVIRNILSVLQSNVHPKLATPCMELVVVLITQEIMHTETQLRKPVCR